MPIYDFICQSCGSEFEKLVSFSSESAVICPECQSSEVERQMGLPAIHFKGSGWYITDSKSTNNGSQPADKNGSSDSSSSTDDAKSETKSETKSDSSDSSSKAESSTSTDSGANTDSGSKKSVPS